MQITTLCTQKLRQVFSGGLFGVLLIFLMPGSILAFQVDSLVIDTTLTGVNLGATAWGDYDNDGDLDLVITGTTNGGNSGAIAELFDNDGSGTFTKNTSVSTTLIGAYRSGADFGDFDNDGDIDLLIVGYNTSNTPTSTLYENNGNGSFSVISGTGFTNVAWADVSFGDYDADGDLDVFLGGLPSNGVRVNNIYSNDGDGTFTNINAGLTGTAGQIFEAFDYDKDGDLDVAYNGYSNSSGFISKFHRNDDGVFIEVTAISNLLVTSEGSAIEWADFDNDGDLDLFNSGNGTANIYINDGNGGLSSSGLTFQGVYGSSADWGDYDLDGDLDLMYVGNLSGSKAYLYQNDGDGTFTLNTDFTFTGAEASTTDWVDIDNDGDLDLFITGYNSGGFRNSSLYRNNELTTNTSPNLVTNTRVTGAGSDVNFKWDTTSDAEGGPIQYNLFIQNLDNNSTRVSSQSDTTSGFRKIIGVGNATSDTIYTANLTTGNYRWGVQAIDAAGKPSAFVKQTLSYSPPTAPANLMVSGVIADVTLVWNASTDPDFQSYKVYQYTDLNGSPISTQSVTDTTLSFLSLERGVTYYFKVSQINSSNFEGLQTSAVSYTTPEILQNDASFSVTGIHLSDSDWGDYDNDGDLDLVLIGTTNGGQSGAIAEIYDNDGSGIFTKNSTISNMLTGVYRGGVAFGDYTNDGYLDLIIAGYNSSNSPSTKLYKNDGSGSFTEVNNTGFENVGYAVTNWMDYDNDGDLDLLLAGLPNSGNRINAIYKNNGDGTFTDSNTGLTGTADGDFMFADYDNDGDMDVAFSGFSDNSGQIAKFYINNGGVYSENTSISNLLIESAGTVMVWGDYDDDGDLDLLNAGGGSSKIIRNNGNGSMTDSGISFGALSQSSGSWGDYDNDGDLDIALSGYTGSTKITKIFKNNGNSTFSEDTSLNLTGQNQGKVQWVDVDNDGDLDLFTHGSDPSSSLNSFLYKNESNLGGASPTTPTNLSVAYNLGTTTFTWDVSTDSDGGPISYNTYVYEVGGQGSTLAAQADTASGFVRTIGLGNAELTNKKRVNLENGTYKFGVQAIDAAGKPSVFAKTTVQVVLPDPVDSLRGERVNDTYTLTWDPVPVATSYKVYFTTDTTAQSTFIATTTDTTYSGNIFPGLTIYYSVKVIDSNSIESVASNYVEIENPFNFQLHTTHSNQIVEIASGGSTNRHKSDIDWVDYDNDGDLDLSIIGESFLNFFGLMVLYKYDSSTGFTRDENFVAEDIILDYGEADWGDYDNDGDLDFVVAGYNQLTSENISTVYKNNGSGVFTEVIAIKIVLRKDRRDLFVKWVDIDNDGDLDIFYNGFNSAAYSYVYLNNGDDSFADASLSFNTLYNSSNLNLAIDEGEIDLIDINGDGYVDVSGTGGIVIGFPFSGISFNSKDNQFTDSGNSLTYMLGSSLEWGDLDADGDPDLVLMGFDSGNSVLKTEIYLNDGTGTLSLHSTLDGYRRGDIALGDIDNDGDLDLVISGLTNTSNTDYSTAGNKVFSNDLSGSNTFIELTGSTLTGLGRGNLVFGDYDGDGDLDLAMNGRYSGGIKFSIYENTASTAGTAPGKPSNFSLVVKQEEVSITWDAATDANGGPLHYEAFVLKPDKTPVFYAKSDTSTDFRQVAALGNAGYNNFITLDVASLERGFYTIGVQAIDATGLAGEFAIEQIPIRTYFNPLGISALKDTVTTIPLSTFQKHSFLNDSTLTLSLRSAPNAQLFIDANNDYIMDAGEVKLDSTGFNLSLLASDSLRIYSDATGFEDIILKIETPSGMVVDSATIQLAMFESAPSISGTADQSGWYLMANPLQTTLGKLFENIWTQGAINADTESGTPNLYTFSQDSAKYIPLTTDLDTTKLAAGTGLLAYLFPDDNYDDAEGPVDGGWPKELANYGNPFGETVQIPVRNVDVDNSNSTTGSEGFSLIGNPYSFPVSVDSLIAELKEVDEYANNYVYLWDPINKRYELQIGGSIESYTSFFVRTIQTGKSGDIDLKYSDYFAPVAPKKVPEIEFEFTLAHNATEQESSWKLKTSEDALAGIDPYDGFYLGSYSSTYANLYSWVDDQPLVINNLPNQSEELFSIPIYIDASLTGEFNLSWDSESLPEGWTVELEDVESGNVIDVRDQNFFEFNYSNKVKVKPNLPTDFYTFGLAKAKRSTSPVFILKVNTGNAVSSENDLGIPREVELYQNYPNPFNPSSIIRFGVPEQAPVRLEVFDILGRKVMTLLNGEVKQAGRYNITFDGRALASGMYIYRLVIGDKVLTKKMTLIK